MLVISGLHAQRDRGIVLDVGREGEGVSRMYLREAKFGEERHQQTALLNCSTTSPQSQPLNPTPLPIIIMSSRQVAGGHKVRFVFTLCPLITHNSITTLSLFSPHHLLSPPHI